jgi:hypothetical protein
MYFKVFKDIKKFRMGSGSASRRCPLPIHNNVWHKQNGIDVMNILPHQYTKSLCGVKGRHVAEKTGWDRVYQELEIVLLQNHYPHPLPPRAGVGRMA